jgi:DNA-binding SARP family transcriptional activator
LLARVYTDRGEYDLALAIGLEAVSTARDVPDPQTLAFALQSLAYMYYGRGAREPGDEVYRELYALMGSLRHRTDITLEVHLHRTFDALASGDVDMASTNARAAIEIMSSNRRTWFACHGLIAAAGAALARGMPDAAARLLCAEVAVRTSSRMLLQVREQRLEGEFLADVERVLGSDTFARVRAEMQSVTLAEALDYAARVLSAPTGATWDVEPQAATVAPGSDRVNGNATLVVRALGPLSITLVGEPLAADAWSYGKPRELLLYLLCHPEGRTREQIGTIFWPEASPTQVKNSFKVMLHHLRRTLGADRVILDGDRCRLNPELDVWFDGRVFEQQMSEALRVSRAGRNGAKRLLRDAVALYRGDFLSGEVVGDWHLEHHDYLRRLFTDGLAALGEALLERGEDAEAVAVFEQLIRLEDLREDAHRSLMRCYTRLGQRGRALRQYELLSALLAEELDAEPELETTRLFESIRQAQPA